MILKRVSVGILVAAAFLVGFSVVADAFPIKGRQEHRGYFTNVLDRYGTDVWPQSGGRAGCRGDGTFALPASVNTKAEFIAFVKCKLGGNTQERTGAAFIIQTMIGTARNRPPTAAQIANWEARINNPALAVNWNTNRSYTVNSFYQGTGSGPNPADDAFYNENGSSSSVVFGVGANAYVIRRQCANPVGNGNIPNLPESTNFNMSGRSEANRATVGPGQSIVFNHFLRNGGPSATTPTDIWWLTMQQPGGARVASGNSGRYISGQEKRVSTETYTVPLNTPVGTQICRNMRWEPDTRQGGLVYGNTVCVRVTALYTLTPSVQASTAAAQEGDRVTFTYWVANSGPTPSGTTNCKPVGNTRDPGHAPLPQQNSDRNSDAGYTPPNTNCPRTFPVTTGSPIRVATEEIEINGLSAGEQVCRSLVVNPMSQAGGARASAERCVVIVKSPAVHFMGGDLAVGNPYRSEDNQTCSLVGNRGNIYTTASSSDAGSTAEYAAFVRGLIQFLPSSGYGFGTASQSGVSSESIRKLSFANTQLDNQYGEYGANNCMTDYYQKYSSEIPATASPGTRTLSGSEERHYSGNLRINTSNISNGARILIVVDGNVTIEGNGIRYSGSYANTGQIPSVAIIAGGNITVNESVRQLDGVYVSKGIIHTCNSTTGALTTEACERQLTLNGVIVTDQLNLRRTYGSDEDNKEEPAERFNYTTELFFNNVLDDTPENRVETVEQRDLPPRY